MIVCAFPQHASNPNGEQYGRYCKYQLIKYKPWQGQPLNAWGGGEDTDSTCIQAYHSFLSTPEAESHIPQFTQKLDQAQQHLAGSESDTRSDSEEATHADDHDEWMLLCRLNPRFTEDDTTQDASVDWSEAARALPSEVLRDCPSWVK